jgi:hypothetical protein
VAPLWVAGLLSVLAHELTEAATDPLLNLWYDLGGAENADICAWKFGTVSTSNGRKYNVNIAGRPYYLQLNLNPTTGLCVAGV